MSFRPFALGALLALAGQAAAQSNGPLDFSWNTIDGGGGVVTVGGFALAGTLGQPDAGVLSNGNLVMLSGFWGLGLSPPPCYADCDPNPPGVLDVFDFLCFQNLYAANDPYACDCDLTSGPAVCDIFDFLCYQNAYGAGCP